MRTKTMVDLRRDLTAVVRAVERGETVLITDRDRPVALMTPVPGAQWPDPEAVAAAVSALPKEGA